MSDSSQRTPGSGEITELLDEIRGSPELFDRLVPLVYDDLKRISRGQRYRMGAGDTLQTTALVHEAFLKLRRRAQGSIDDRQHFCHLAARVMRQLILDYARRQLTAKRGGDQARATWIEEEHGLMPADLDRIMAIEKAIEAMSESDERMAECLAANLFAGYTVEEIGEMLGISSRTVVRDLRRARAWLKVELAHLDGPAA